MSASVDRRRVVSVVATLGVAAAVTLVLIVLVAGRDDDVTPADEPSPTATVPLTTPPRALPNAPGRQFPPGTYFVDKVDGIPTPRIFATIGAGWFDPSPAGWVMWKIDSTSGNFIDGQIGYLMFSRPGRVYSDACHWEDGYHPGPVTTVDDLVAALSEQAGWAEVTAPSDISVDGYAGKAFQRTAPTVMPDCPTRTYNNRLGDTGPHPDFRSWANEDGTVSVGGFDYEPGEIETLWVLDIDGTVVVIHTRLFAGPLAAANADFADAVLDSIRIDPG